MSSIEFNRRLEELRSEERRTIRERTRNCVGAHRDASYAESRVIAAKIKKLYRDYYGTQKY